MDCDICCHSYNKTVRREIKCNYCQERCCVSCHQTYLLDSVHEAHCMFCKKIWSKEFMNEQFSAKFLMKDYREKREIIYFKQEETFFTDLLLMAEHQKKLNQNIQKVNDTKSKIKENDEKEDQLVLHQRRIHRQLQQEMNQLLKEQVELRNSNIKQEKINVIMKCTNEPCKGFLNSKFYCGLCQSQVCRHCHRIEQDEKHSCHPDDVATIKELQRSTKPCPKCHTRIFKTDGCDQMFCVQCHTPFSWRTGLEETGVIHNPHYFEALRAGQIHHQRHQIHQGACGVMRDQREINMILRKAFSSRSEQEAKTIRNEFFHYYQQFVHHRAITLNRLNRIEDRTHERIQFLIGKIDEKKFKQRLYVHHQTTLRKIEEQQIIDTYVSTGEDLFRLLSDSNAWVSLEQLRTLTLLSYTALIDIDHKYQHKGIIKPTDIQLY